MSSLLLAIAVAACFAAAWALTEAFRRYAVHARIIDEPNARSAHRVPVPRGGGVAFALTSLVAIALAGLEWPALRNMAFAIGGGGAMVVMLGFVDDRRHVPARVRLAGHLLAALWFFAWLEPIPPVPILGVPVNLGVAGFALALLHLVWSVNFFNFMDGIDGLAATEAITTLLGGALVWWLAGVGPGWIVPIAVAASVAGFLVWNWPPARIFMGDAGSGYLGFVTGGCALWCGQGRPALFWAWFILVGCFMVDATTTLVRRVRRGEHFSEAHRSHAYQYAARRAGRHLAVTAGVAAINVCWLLPIALLVASGRLDGVAGVAIAYAPLLWLAFRFKAGASELQHA